MYIHIISHTYMKTCICICICTHAHKSNIAGIVGLPWDHFIRAEYIYMYIYIEYIHHVYVCVCIYIYTYICISLYLYIYIDLSIYPSIYRSIYLSIYLFIHLSIYLSIYICSGILGLRVDHFIRAGVFYFQPGQDDDAGGRCGGRCLHLRIDRSASIYQCAFYASAHTFLYLCMFVHVCTCMHTLHV